MVELESDSELRQLPGAIAFGTFVGLVHGALAGVACCWFVGEMDYWLLASIMGAALGGGIGTLIGSKRGKIRNGEINPDIGTLTAISCGLFPATLALIGIGLAGGKMGIGVAFVGPMIGLCTGGVCDRAYEARIRRALESE